MGFIRWMLSGLRKFGTQEIESLCQKSEMRFDPELQKRRVRGTMQMQAQKSHTGEPRWTNMDQWLLESMSSGCAIVGFFIGYSVAMGKATSRLCGSRVHEAETTIDWMMMPR